MTDEEKYKEAYNTGWQDALDKVVDLYERLSKGVDFMATEPYVHPCIVLREAVILIKSLKKTKEDT